MHLLFFLCFLAFHVTNGAPFQEQLPPPCDSEIYCRGPLLHTVQMARLFQDSKTFVDKKLRYNPQLIITNFNQLVNSTNGEPSKEVLARFVADHFDSEGSEFEPWDPSDWVSQPDFLGLIKDSQLKMWGLDLHDAWKFLGRKIKDDVRDNPELYSMIYVPNPVIVPGGRFREFYYWDSYWIVQGLLISGMNHTVKGMLSNFLQLVDTMGLIPNGGRIYYEQRSQPPMLISMMERYINSTGDLEFLRSNIHLLDKEMKFWMVNRTVKVNGHTLARFNVEFDGPRPESYREDFETAQSMDETDRSEFYMNMKSGAESGWDFSSRWYIVDNANNVGNLTHIKTRNILPVDLNAFICMNARLLSEMYATIGDDEMAEIYYEMFIQWRDAIHEIMWNEKEGVWFDYDLINNKQRPYFYPSNLAPLWAGAWNPTAHDVEVIVDRIFLYLDKSHATKFCGGVPTSMHDSGQQWDFPNGWPPLQQLIIQGLENTGDPRAKKLAFDLAQKWILNNFEAYKESMPNAMFEKYDVTVVGLPGGGGEYDVQLGFGWTNGVILELLTLYGDRLTSQADGVDCSRFPSAAVGIGGGAAFVAAAVG